MSAEFLKPEYLVWLLRGFWLTVQISLLTIPLATLLGLALALGREVRWPGLARSIAALVALFRNSPLLVQLFFWYFGLPALLPEAWREWLNAVHVLKLGGAWVLEWPSYEFLSASLGLILYSAAFVAEEIRAGLCGVAPAQRQAAEAPGLSPVQVFRHVIAPQAIRIALPPLMGQYMNIVKNSSLAMAVGVMELSYAARQVETVSFRTFQAYAVATLLYVLIIAGLEVLALLARQHFPVAGARR